MENMLATTPTSLSGTRCATHMALRPVGSGSTWKMKPSRGSMTWVKVRVRGCRGRGSAWGLWGRYYAVTTAPYHERLGRPLEGAGAVEALLLGHLAHERHRLARALRRGRPCSPGTITCPHRLLRCLASSLLPAPCAASLRPALAAPLRSLRVAQCAQLTFALKDQNKPVRLTLIRRASSTSEVRSRFGSHMGHDLCKNRYSHIALCCGYTFIIRNHRIDSTSQVQTYYHYHDYR